MKGTELEQMSMDYRFIRSQKYFMLQTLKSKNEAIPRLKAERDALRSRYNDLKNLQQLEETIQNLKHEFAWALVRDEETV